MSSESIKRSTKRNVSSGGYKLLSPQKGQEQLRHFRRKKISCKNLS